MAARLSGRVVTLPRGGITPPLQIMPPKRLPLSGYCLLIFLRARVEYRVEGRTRWRDQEAINGFVLAGGKSSRMGQDKALMRLEGKPLVLRAAEILRPFVREITLLAPAGRYENLGLPVVADKWPDQGPLAAVCTGLLSSHAEWNIFLACDLPLVSRQFTPAFGRASSGHAFRCRGAAH